MEKLKENLNDNSENNSDILKNSTNDEYSDFSFNGIKTNCKVVDMYDADTFRIVFFLKENDKKPLKIKVRASGCNASEMYPSKSHPEREEEMKKARLARNRLLDLVIEKNDNFDTENINYKREDIEKFLSENKKLNYIHLEKYDKYGRVLGTLFRNKDDEKSINQILIDEKHAVSYSGGKRV